MTWALTYLLLFLGIFFEGEFVLLSAVIAAHQGYMNIYWVAGISVVATMLSDLFYFYLGLNKAEKWLERRPEKLRAKIARINEKLAKNRMLLLLTYRFLYGFRMLTPFVLGMQKTKPAQFVGFSLATTLLWATTFISVGWIFGEKVLEELKHFEKLELFVIGGLLLIALLSLLLKRVLKQ